MTAIAAESIAIAKTTPFRLHIDLAEMRASNWIFIEGWMADLEKGPIGVASSWRNANCVISERPDVCVALGRTDQFAFGFSLHLMTPDSQTSGRVSATLTSGGREFASLQIDLPKTLLQPLPFATPKAIELTQALYRDVKTGRGLHESARAVVLSGGVIAAANMPLAFDNTRIGNYHPDILEILQRPGAVGLDIGCGIRDVVFDNLVTQDIYLTPTATLITAPGDARLPFADGSFDLVLLDSVLEHVPDPVALLAESRRLLKPGGAIFGDVPFLQPLHLAPHHYFNFTPYGLEVVAKNAGLELQYAAAEAHQRPEFSLEWLLRRTFETVSAAEAERLKSMTIADFYAGLARDKNMIAYPAHALTEMAAGFRFHMVKPCG